MKGKQKFKFRIRLVLALAFVSALALSVISAPHAFAVGDAYFSLSPSSGSYTVGNSFTVTVYETSSAGDNTNAAQANLSYNASLLQFNSSSLGAFTLCTNNGGGGGSVSVACAASSTQSGTQAVVSVSFKVIASGTASVNLTSGSDIDSTSGSSVWDGALKSASFNLSAPATSSGSTGTKTSATPKTTSPTPAPAPTPTPPTPSPTTTQQPGGASNQQANAAVTIIVTDTNGKPVKNAKVTLDGKTTMYTDAEGKANFAVETAGSHSVEVTAPGKKPYHTNVTLAANESVPLELQLTSASSNGLLYGIAGVVGLLLVAGGVLYFFRAKLPWLHGSEQFVPLSAASQPIVGYNGSQNIPQPTVLTPTSTPAPNPPQPQPQQRGTSSHDSLDGMRRRF